MNLLTTIILPLLIAYFIGSIPTSVWVGRIFHGVDVRNEGSGNAGATNTIRVLGLTTGLPVLLFDIFKGFIAVFILKYFDSGLSGDHYVYLQIGMAAMAVVGHIFPVYAGFKGGKGVATIAGAGIALYPWAFLIILGVFILTFIISKTVSISSITAAICFPLIVILITNETSLPLILLSLAVGVFIPITHRKNIKRLIKGEEPKFKFKRKAS
ncbi:MAG: acyl-phosphate glycerol 3-phosphate acyltransferase [Bacteroidetes bacterium]|nr:acyl-phosphate glycerol 3-phosphate acyltransferase [Bacteroidota bacterium]